MTRFGLDGSVRDLREDVGNFALVVGEKGDRILFQEKGDSWHTCDLNGGDVEMVGKGLSRLDFPSASPDGKRVIMIEHDEKEQTCPVVVDLATGEVKKAKAEEGRWVLPVWR
jgi:tricorn protease-like protein